MEPSLIEDIVRALVHVAPCADGPDCVWCPAEAVERMLIEKGWVR